MIHPLKIKGAILIELLKGWWAIMYSVITVEHEQNYMKFLLDDSHKTKASSVEIYDAEYYKVSVHLEKEENDR